MNQENRKPLWLWTYYIISLVFFILGVVIVLTDKTGFGILVAWPLGLAGILFAIISYIVYRSKRSNKRIMTNVILWIPFLLSVATLIWVIIQMATWFDTSAFQGWPILIGNLILSIILLVLIIILNKRS